MTAILFVQRFSCKGQVTSDDKIHTEIINQHIWYYEKTPHEKTLHKKAQFEHDQ